MKGILEYSWSELLVRGSRFLAEAFPVETQEEARELLKSQKAKYADATHVVHAFVLGSTGGILGCSDDGEPSGTAGRPVLDVLKGSGLTGIMLTVTRWFGGTLLGTGGLVKAYADAAKAVLETVRSAELVEVRDFTVEARYEMHEHLIRELARFGAEVTGENFGETVTISGSVEEARSAELAALVTSVTSGRSCAKTAPQTRTGRKA
ncbi:MAG TPA: YigZ family protein [Treponemataceae bacterium]|nr:YigZ family protein [Treponemataceae bacterium]HQL31771.1 YigZ family protein [Treponemataceae bacterium]